MTIAHVVVLVIPVNFAAHLPFMILLSAAAPAPLSKLRTYCGPQVKKLAHLWFIVRLLICG